MVTVKHNLKDTDIIYIFDKKNIDKDIKEIITNALNYKKFPFHDVYIFIKNEIPVKCLNELNKNLKIKTIKKTKEQTQIKI